MKLLTAGHLFCPGRNQKGPPSPPHASISQREVQGEGQRAEAAGQPVSPGQWEDGSRAGGLARASPGRQQAQEGLRPHQPPTTRRFAVSDPQRGMSEHRGYLSFFMKPLSAFCLRWAVALSNWPSGLRMPDAVILINNYFTEIYSYSQTVEISRNKSLGRKSSREETGIAKAGFCFCFSFSFLKYVTKFKGIMAKPQNHHC